MEREDVEKYLKENLKGVRVEPKKIIMGGWTVLEPIIFLELKDGYGKIKGVNCYDVV